MTTVTDITDSIQNDSSVTSQDNLRKIGINNNINKVVNKRKTIKDLLEMKNLLYLTNIDGEIS